VSKGVEPLHSYLLVVPPQASSAYVGHPTFKQPVFSAARNFESVPKFFRFEESHRGQASKEKGENLLPFYNIDEVDTYAQLATMWHSERLSHHSVRS
jgi:hypothetical protein